MRYRRIHPWTVSIPRARRIQEDLRARLDLTPDPRARAPRLVAGADVSYDRGSDVMHGAVVVLSWPDLAPVEVASAVARTRFPYVPGYLSFREIPILLRAFRKIRRVPDLILCDGQGIAHPRGLGLASHLGLILGVPTIGCAKSLLVGRHEDVDAGRGSSASLIHERRRVGTVLRTRDGVAPLYVSPGHAIDHRTASRLVLQCCVTRIPEPVRRAHIEVNRLRREHGARAPVRVLRAHRPRADQIGLISPPSPHEPDTPSRRPASPPAAGPRPRRGTTRRPTSRARPWAEA